MFGAINCKTVRPFTRKLPEFKFWWSGARATAIALVWGPEYRYVRTYIHTYLVYIQQRGAITKMFQVFFPLIL